MIQASSFTRIIVEAVKTWMKKNAGKYIPSFKELKAAMNLEVGDPANYTIMKQRAFRELEHEGFILKYNDKRTVAAIDNFNPPADVAEKTAAKICGLEVEQEPTKEPTPVDDAARIVENFRKKLDNLPPEELEKMQKQPKPPFLLYINKPCIPATGSDGLGTILSTLSQMPDAEKTNLSIQIQVKELGAGK